MKKNKKFSIDPKDKKNAKKSLDEIARDSNKIIGDNISGGWLEKISPSPDDSDHK